MSLPRAWSLPLSLSLLLASAPATAAEEPPAGTLELVECEEVGQALEARCGRLWVAEDPERGAGRRIPLYFLVVPAEEATGSKEAVLFLLGGPGEAATDAAPFLAGEYAETGEVKDLLFVDVRGTGRSHPLRCPYQDAPGRPAEYLRDFLPTAGVKECATHLAAIADLEHYSTPYLADDLERVRAALGYERLDLVGLSYGTRLALEVARRHPGSVRTLSLLGPVPFDARMPLFMARDTEDALRAWLGACAADPDCSSAFPDPAGDLRQALGHLAGPAVSVTLTHPETGEPLPFVVDRPLFLQTLRYQLYQPHSAVRVPLLLHEAAAGRFRPIAEAAYAIGLSYNTMPDGLYLTVTCAEDVPFIPPDEGVVLARDTFLGTLRVDSQRAACAVWPTAAAEASFHEPLVSDIPTLLEVGAHDPATPPRWAWEIAAGLANDLVIVVPHGAHGKGGLRQAECLGTVQQRFLATASVAGHDLSCLDEIEPPAFVTEPDPEPVVLPVAQLARLAGTYRGDSLPVPLVVSLEGERLRASLGPESFFLIPVGPLDFGLAGGPPGLGLGFVETDGEVTAVVLRGGPPTELRRVPE